MAKKIALSIFIILNIGVVLFMNRPEPWVRKMESFPYPLRYAGWLVRHYAYYTGLNNQWQMFGRQSRFNWWYQIYGEYADGSRALLPLPRQSPRTFFQKQFIDFKEVKFHLNLYPRERAREAYAYFLCRNFPQLKVEKIHISLMWQEIFSSKEARIFKSAVHSQAHEKPLDEFKCPTP